MRLEMLYLSAVSTELRKVLLSTETPTLSLDMAMNEIYQRADVRAVTPANMYANDSPKKPSSLCFQMLNDAPLRSQTIWASSSTSRS